MHSMIEKNRKGPPLPLFGPLKFFGKDLKIDLRARLRMSRGVQKSDPFVNFFGVVEI